MIQRAIRYELITCTLKRGMSILLIGLIAGCGPKESVEFRQVRNISLRMVSTPMLTGDVVFFNPNKNTMKLNKIKIDVFVDGQKSAEIDQKIKMHIPAEKEFTVPIEVKLAIEEKGFLGTVFGMIGGKTKEVRYKGHITATYHGFPVRVPVDYKSEIRIKI